MSQMGHERPKGDVSSESVQPPITDMLRMSWHFRFVPGAAILINSVLIQPRTEAAFASSKSRTVLSASARCSRRVSGSHWGHFIF